MQTFGDLKCLNWKQSYFNFYILGREKKQRSQVVSCLKLECNGRWADVLTLYKTWAIEYWILGTGTTITVGNWNGNWKPMNKPEVTDVTKTLILNDFGKWSFWHWGRRCFREDMRQATSIHDIKENSRHPLCPPVKRCTGQCAPKSFCSLSVCLWKDWRREGRLKPKNNTKHDFFAWNDRTNTAWPLLDSKISCVTNRERRRYKNRIELKIKKQKRLKRRKN